MSPPSTVSADGTAPAEGYAPTSPQVNPDTPICLDFLKGRCTRSQCRFLHPDLSQYEQLSEAVQAQAGRRVCEVWAMTGTCKFGAKCSRLHPSVVVNQQPAPVLTMLLPVAVVPQSVFMTSEAPGFYPTVPQPPPSAALPANPPSAPHGFPATASLAPHSSAFTGVYHPRVLQPSAAAVPAFSCPLASPPAPGRLPPPGRPLHVAPLPASAPFSAADQGTWGRSSTGLWLEGDQLWSGMTHPLSAHVADTSRAGAIPAPESRQSPAFFLNEGFEAKLPPGAAPPPPPATPAVPRRRPPNPDHARDRLFLDVLRSLHNARR